MQRKIDQWQQTRVKITTLVKERKPGFRHRGTPYGRCSSLVEIVIRFYGEQLLVKHWNEARLAFPGASSSR